MVVSWQEHTLGEICDEVGGTIRTGPFGSQLHQDDYSDNGVPVVMPQDLIDSRIAIGSIARVDDSHAQRLSRHRVRAGDILYGRRGDIGRRALVTGGESGWLCGTGCLRISLGSAVLDPRYLFYFLGDAGVVAWVSNQAIGATMPNLNTTIIRSVRVRYPDLPVQRKIASVLSAYDDLIDNNLRRIKIVEEMARSLYKEWFVDFRFPGRESVKMVGSPLGMIPEGWTIASLEDYCSTQYGYTESASAAEVGPKFLRGMDINKGSFIDWTDVSYCPIADEVLEKFRLLAGDVVMIRMADPGKVGIVEAAIDAVFASYLVRLRPVDDRISPYFLFYSLLGDAYQDFIQGASSGTTRRSASAVLMTQFDLALPETSLMQRFEDQVAVLRSLLTVLLKKNHGLRRSRDLLLPKLISGELDVSELDIDLGENAA